MQTLQLGLPRERVTGNDDDEDDEKKENHRDRVSFNVELRVQAAFVLSLLMDRRYRGQDECFRMGLHLIIAPQLAGKEYCVGLFLCVFLFVSPVVIH